MKATGMVRRIDDLGRIVIPSEIRRRYGMHEGDPIEIFATDDGIELVPYDMERPLAEDLQRLHVRINDALWKDADKEAVNNLIKALATCIAEGCTA